MAKEFSQKLIAQNKKARYDYFIEQTYQAGIALTGTEVKSLRAGKCSLKESYVKIDKEEAYIYNMHISPYKEGNVFNSDPLRTRKLLLHKREIHQLFGKSTQQSYTIVALKIYFEKSWVKLDIALARGKKNYDKRETLAKKDQLRQIQKDFKIRNIE